MNGGEDGERVRLHDVLGTRTAEAEATAAAGRGTKDAPQYLSMRPPEAAGSTVSATEAASEREGEEQRREEGEGRERERRRIVK